MSSTDAHALQRSDLNSFLYADIGVEASGMTLSVLSILARRGVDPWQEASRLAKLPRAAAIDGLTSMIAALPASVWTQAEAAAIAARLVGLLPRRGDAPPATAARSVAWTIPGVLLAVRTDRRWLLPLLLALLACLSLALVHQHGTFRIAHASEAGVPLHPIKGEPLKSKT